MKTISILLVEDDESLAQLISILLKQYLQANVEIKENGWQALDLAMSKTFDLVILDIMLPGMNGLEICKKLRASYKYLPILMLTAKSEEIEKLEGFDCGADDYITKPFNQMELMARLKALLRRSNLETNAAISNFFQVGDLQLDTEKRTLKKSSMQIDVTAKEFDLMYFFMKHPGRAFSRIQLLNEVWGSQFDGLEHTVNSTINRLRNKVEENINDPKYILTAWGVGYKFRDK